MDTLKILSDFSRDQGKTDVGLRFFINRQYDINLEKKIIKKKTKSRKTKYEKRYR